MWQVGAIRSGSVYGVPWGVRSGGGYLFGYAAIQGAARLVVAPGAMAPAVASASCQHFGADRLGVGDLLRRLRFGGPRRRSRSVGASAPAPGSVARSSTDVLTVPATLSGCPCMVDMVRGSFRLCSAGGWLHVFQIVTARNGKVTLVFEAFRLADFWKQAIRTRLDRFLREKNALMFWKIDRFLILSKCSQQFHVRAHTKSHWQKM